MTNYQCLGAGAQPSSKALRSYIKALVPNTCSQLLTNFLLMQILGNNSTTSQPHGRTGLNIQLKAGPEPNVLKKFRE